MKTHPMLFSAAMVQALLDGRKTQTRRLLKPQPKEPNFKGMFTDDNIAIFGKDGEDVLARNCEEIRLPIQPGDLIWVKETYRFHTIADLTKPGWMSAGDAIQYEADGEQSGRLSSNGGFIPGKTRVSIHMPRQFSRLTLEVTDVRVQRLQEITEADARAEGIERLKSGRGYYDPTMSKGNVHLGCYFDWAADAFETLWDSLNAKRAPWSSNPWVVAYSFKVHKCNVDEVPS